MGRVSRVRCLTVRAPVRKLRNLLRFRLIPRRLGMAEMKIAVHSMVHTPQPGMMITQQNRYLLGI